MTPASAALLLAAIALVIAAYVVACDRFDRGDHDGPWSIGAVLLAGLLSAPMVATSRPVPAQAEGACLPLLMPGMSTRPNLGNAAPEAHAPATAGPAGVPGSLVSRGAAPFHAATANGGSPQGPGATIAGRHLGRGGSVERRG